MLKHQGIPTGKLTYLLTYLILKGKKQSMVQGICVF